mmetsp:Transcript_29116/g.89185  ORF Transcript_29116/g.89185 Transcript_29116/m.89185 type:complete len:332 (-) Transcript_29116:51-1046(-)
MPLFLERCLRLGFGVLLFCGILLCHHRVGCHQLRVRLPHCGALLLFVSEPRHYLANGNFAHGLGGSLLENHLLHNLLDGYLLDHNLFNLDRHLLDHLLLHNLFHNLLDLDRHLLDNFNDLPHNPLPFHRNLTIDVHNLLNLDLLDHLDRDLFHHFDLLDNLVRNTLHNLLDNMHRLLNNHLVWLLHHLLDHLLNHDLLHDLHFFDPLLVHGVIDWLLDHLNLLEHNLLNLLDLNDLGDLDNLDHFPYGLHRHLDIHLLHHRLLNLSYHLNGELADDLYGDGHHLWNLDLPFDQLLDDDLHFPDLIELDPLDGRLGLGADQSASMEWRGWRG